MTLGQGMTLRADRIADRDMTQAVDRIQEVAKTLDLDRILDLNRNQSHHMIRVRAMIRDPVRILGVVIQAAVIPEVGPTRTLSLIVRQSVQRATHLDLAVTSVKTGSHVLVQRTVMTKRQNLSQPLRVLNLVELQQRTAVVTTRATGLLHP